MKDLSLDSIIEDFNVPPMQDLTPREESRCITLWVPSHLKEKYDEIQKRSGRTFGKRLRQLCVTAIEKVDIE